MYQDYPDDPEWKLEANRLLRGDEITRGLWISRTEGQLSAFIDGCLAGNPEMKEKDEALRYIRQHLNRRRLSDLTLLPPPQPPLPSTPSVQTPPRVQRITPRSGGRIFGNISPIQHDNSSPSRSVFSNTNRTLFGPPPRTPPPSQRANPNIHTHYKDTLSLKF